MTQNSTLSVDQSEAPPSNNRPVGLTRAATARYLVLYLAPLVIAAIVGAGLYGFLVRAGETVGPVSAAHRQAETGELYGPALVYRPFAFKLERYRQIKPDVLLVGSSRVMAFAGEAFATSMLNSGGGANTLDQAIKFTETALAIHRPKTILLGLDFWWFNPNRDDEVDTTTHDSDEIDLSLSQLLMPVDWIASGQVSIREVVATLTPFGDRRPGIGVLAKFARQGFDRYGRYDYGALFDGGLDGEDEMFARTLRRLRDAGPSSKFNVRPSPAPAALSDLRGFLQRMRASGVEIMLFLPPVAEPVRAQLSDDPEDRLLPQWRAALREFETPILDFEDARLIGSPPCEFIDGFHGGEVTYLRVLDAIAGAGGSILAESIDREAVAALIAGNAGHARIRELRPAGTPTEVDFLKLGCDKRG
ncbi:MAG: hypothetical protein JNL25_08700 [Rhodospirillaceae bacterium]|nr:hypothetical protein [Rhodospirillaceae bacterium]